MLKKLIRNQRGDMTFLSIFVVLAINILIAMLFLFANIQILTINIRNAAKMELNNLTASIYADTYRSQREGNFEEYLATLYSSDAYTRELNRAFQENLEKTIPFSPDKYSLHNIELSFSIADGRIRYTFRCTVHYYIRMFGNNYPIVREIELTGYHNTKY